MNYKRLGDFIEPCNEKNKGDVIKLLQGISNRKYFQKAKTNTIGVDLSKYRIVRTGQFAFNRATTRNGDRISIALRFKEDCIVSPSYRIFKSKDENILKSEYLMMWFKRPEFDRYARFRSHGSAHEFFDYDEMCEVTLPIPSIEKQQQIVAEYNTVTSRILLNEKINTNLEATAQALYKHWFVDFEFPNTENKPYKSSGGEMVYNEELDKDIPVGWSVDEINKFGDVVTGKTPSSKTPEHFGVDFQFVTPTDFNKNTKFILSTARNLSKLGYEKLKNKSLRQNDIIITCIGSDMGKVALSKKNAITNQQMNSIKVFENSFSDYLYAYFKEFKDELKSIAMGSSTMPMISKSEFELIKILKPNLVLLENYYKKVTPINLRLSNSISQSETLKELQSLLLAKMTQNEVEKEMV